MAVRDIVGLARQGSKTDPAKKRKDRPLGKSEENPSLGDAMRGGGGSRGGGGKCVGCNNPQGVTGGSHRAEKMDKGLPLFDKKNGE